MSGMRAEVASPAGVSAPVMLNPTVTSGSRILRAKSWQASRSRPALYESRQRSTRSTIDVVGEIGSGSIFGRRERLGAAMGAG